MMLRRIHWVFIDVLLVSFACALAYLLRFLPEQFAPVPSFEYPLYIRQALWVLPILVVLRIWLFKFFSLYRGISRYAGMHELIQIVMATTVGTTTLALWDMAWFFLGKMALFGIPSRIPVGVVVVDWMACIVLVGGARMFPRFLELSRIDRSGSIRNVIVVGAGEVGEIVVRNFLQNPQMGYRPVGFLDDDDHLWHHQIHGLEVFGPVDHLPECIQKYDITDVLVAVPKPSLRFMNHIVEICERAHVDFKIVPAMSDLMEKRVSITQIRNVEIEDLLGREPADIGLPDDRNYLQDEVVLVTGAGGSIGSELCRQIMQSKPKQLLMLDHGENNLYELAIELHYDFREKNLEILVADIQDVERMEKIFADYKPTVVFHAAAHKHVPLMELHPSEAIKNNVVRHLQRCFHRQPPQSQAFHLDIHRQSGPSHQCHGGQQAHWGDDPRRIEPRINYRFHHRPVWQCSRKQRFSGSPLSPPDKSRRARDSHPPQSRTLFHGPSPRPSTSFCKRGHWLGTGSCCCLTWVNP